MDTLKKLKGRDKKIAELMALNEKLAAQQQPEGESSSTASLQFPKNVCAFELSVKPLCSTFGVLLHPTYRASCIGKMHAEQKT